MGLKTTKFLWTYIGKQYNTIKSRRTTKRIKSNINEITVESEKSEDQMSTMKSIKTFYEPRKKVIELFDNYSRIVSEAK